MKITSIIALFLLFNLNIFAKLICPVIPLPNQVEKNNNVFTLNYNTVLTVNNESLEQLANYLQKEIHVRYNKSIPITKKERYYNINLRLNKHKKKDVPIIGAYNLSVTEKEIVIESNNSEGIFNGIQTLLQLINSGKKTGNIVEIEGWGIVDTPLYQWRGFMLDESRHFFGTKKVKQILDWMAYYKLNKFHWHLTDQHGWRIDIKNYPKLSRIGGIGNYHDELAKAKYYTQQEILEIVNYAKDRFIEIIPEIDMPGHASAANKAYPEYSGGGSKSHPEYTFNPGKDSVYTYLTNILREVDVLFPSQKIHIGGDEVHYGNERWSDLVDVKQLMKREKLKDLKEVENYFFKRIADSLLRLDNKILAWDEVANADVPANETILFWWRHNRPEQLKIALARGMAIVMCPRYPMYFDYMQDSLQVYGPDYKKFTLNSVENVYKFSQDNYGIEIPKINNILGIQANLWTERIRTENRLDYMLFPRLAALAESAWTAKNNKDFISFSDRIKKDFILYEKNGIYYFNYQDRKKTGEPKY